jgi:hypothetical protein
VGKLDLILSRGSRKACYTKTRGRFHRIRTEDKSGSAQQKARLILVDR